MSPEGDEILIQIITPSGRYGVQRDTASLLKQREGRRGGRRSPELKMFSILERCDSDREPEAFTQNDGTV